MKFTQFIIIILIIINIATTVWFGVNNKPTYSGSTVAAQAAQNTLPPTITKEIKNKILNDFILNFNSANYDKVYDMLGAAAKAQISKDKIKPQLDILFKTFVSIQSGSYTYSELVSSKGDASFYSLHYLINTENSAMSKTAILTVTILVQGNEYQIYGMNINSNGT